MAYSNWGAFVYENGERRKDKEDVAVFDTDEANVPSGLRIFSNLMKNREKYGDEAMPWHEHSHHAVIGDGPIRLCGYKCGAKLWRLEPDGSIKRVELPDLCSADGEIIRASVCFWVNAKEHGEKKTKQFAGVSGT